MRIRQQERYTRIRIVCLQLPRKTGHRAEIALVGYHFALLTIARDRGHVSVANRIPDKAHTFVVPNATHIPIIEIDNTRSCT